MKDSRHASVLQNNRIDLLTIGLKEMTACVNYFMVIQLAKRCISSWIQSTIIIACGDYDGGSYFMLLNLFSGEDIEPSNLIVLLKPR